MIFYVYLVLHFSRLEFYLDRFRLFCFLLDLVPELRYPLLGLLFRQQLFEFFAMGLDSVSVILANLTLGPASPEEAVVVANQKISFLLVFLLQCDYSVLQDSVPF